MENFFHDKQKRNDFFIGFIGGLIVSGLFVLVEFSDLEIIRDLYSYFYISYIIIMIVSPIYFGKILRPFVSLGILFSYFFPVIFFAFGMLILWGFANTGI